MACVSPLWAHQPWLSQETLGEFFPEAENFVSRKKTLKPEDIYEIEKLAGDKIHEVDKDLTIYVALGRDAQSGRFRSIGAVLMVDAQGIQGLVDLIVAYELNCTVKKVAIAANEDDQRLESQPFLKQFEGRSLSDSWDPDKDFQLVGNQESARAVVRAVRRGMYLLQSILNR